MTKSATVFVLATMLSPAWAQGQANSGNDCEENPDCEVVVVTGNRELGGRGFVNIRPPLVLNNDHLVNADDQPDGDGEGEVEDPLNLCRKKRTDINESYDTCLEKVDDFENKCMNNVVASPMRACSAVSLIANRLVCKNTRDDALKELNKQCPEEQGEENPD